MISFETSKIITEKISCESQPPYYSKYTIHWFSMNIQKNICLTLVYSLSSSAFAYKYPWHSIILQTFQSTIFKVFKMFTFSQKNTNELTRTNTFFRIAHRIDRWRKTVYSYIRCCDDANILYTGMKITLRRRNIYAGRKTPDGILQ